MILLKPPYFIAEMSANHCGSITKALKIIKCAKKYGADAIKLQTFTPKSMTINSKKKYFKINKGLWKGHNLWDLYEKAQTPLEWHKKLFSFGKKIGITVFSSPFDETSVDFLENLGCPMYKVASFEMTDIPLIKKIASTNKPIIISVGMASINEIKLTYNTAKKYGASDITLLYCVSNYPSKISDFNLNNIKVLKDVFKCRIGLSDHSLDHRVAAAAIAAGAEVIEKHIGFENQRKGLDIKFSLKGKEIKEFRNVINDTYKLLGEKKFYRSKSESKSKLFRRSVFAVKDIKKGENFNKENIRRIRPGHGVSPIYYEKLINKKSPINIKAEEPIKLNILKKLKLIDK